MTPLEPCRDILFSQNKSVAGNPDNSLIRPTGHRRWQLRPSFGSDISANYSKIAGGEFENVRTARKGDRLSAIEVWIRTKTPEEHAVHCVIGLRVTVGGTAAHIEGCSVNGANLIILTI